MTNRHGDLKPVRCRRDDESATLPTCRRCARLPPPQWLRPAAVRGDSLSPARPRPRQVAGEIQFRKLSQQIGLPPTQAGASIAPGKSSEGDLRLSGRGF